MIDGPPPVQDATSWTREALVEASYAEDDGRRRVLLRRLRVARRTRRGARMFFLACTTTMTGCEGGRGGSFDVQLSCMRARGDGVDERENAAWLGADEHAAAYERSAPGAVVACAVGVLERRRAAGGEGGEGGLGVGQTAGSGDADEATTSASRRCRTCGVMSCKGTSAPDACPFGGVPTLRVERISFERPGDGDDDDDAGDACWIVFDMAFDAGMTHAEHGALSRQVSMCVAANKRAKMPFRIAVASDNPADDCRGGGAETAPDLPRTTDEGADAISPFIVDGDIPEASRGTNSWRRLPWRRWGARCGGPGVWRTFKDTRRLIYLTADSPNVLENVETGDVFVIGGVVDHKEKPGIALDRASSAAAAGWRTARLPLEGHVRLLKNAHLPCLAVVQLLIMQREVAAEAASGRGSSASTQQPRDAVEQTDRWSPSLGGKRTRSTETTSGSNDEEVVREGGRMAAVWGRAIAQCPAFRCAPLRKYVVWLPPYDHLNDKEELRPAGVTDVRALML